MEVGSVTQKQGDVSWIKLITVEMKRGRFIQEIGDIMQRT